MDQREFTLEISATQLPCKASCTNVLTGDKKQRVICENWDHSGGFPVSSTHVRGSEFFLGFSEAL